MLVYDSLSDEYKREFEPEFSDEYGNDNEDTSGPVAIVRCNNSRSSRGVSLRSFRRNFLLTRIISKTGRLNTFLIKLPNKHIQYFRDFGNTLLNIRWRWILLTLFLVNFLIFFLFGLLWMWMAYVSGDFETDTITDGCVVNTRHYIGYVLLTIESIMTIGYGYRYPTEKCINGWIIMISQAFVSVTIQGALVSIVYVKVAKPFTKNSKSLFSRKAVICLRDGKLCFIFRIKDKEGKITGALNIKTYFIDKENIEENFNLKQIKIEPYGFLIFPMEIVHIIDNRSPLWGISPFQLLKKRFEIIAVAEGNSLITGQLSQNRVSYINSDILWGYRFCSCIDFNFNKMKYVVNYKQFNQIVPFDTPLCSPEELEQIKYNLLCKECNETKENNDSGTLNLYLGKTD